MAEPFVIHAHSGYPGSPLHYDLMLRRGAVLATWQMEQSPLEVKVGQSVPAKKIKDHRLVYLTYEGPVSGGRGAVARQDEGTYELLTSASSLRSDHSGSRTVEPAEEAEGWRVRFEGRGMRGIYLLRREKGDNWSLVCESAG